MTAQPEPKQVREIAREAALLAAYRVDDVDTAIDRSGVLGDRPADVRELPAWRQERGALYGAVREELRRAQVVVSWPDEQPQAERDSCIHCGRDFSLPYVTRQTGTNRCEDCTATCGFPGCGHPDHQRADCPALAQAEDKFTAAVAELGRWVVEPAPAIQAERDADVRAVRALTSATNKMLGRWADANETVRRELWTEVHERADDLYDRFRERFAALDAGESDPSGGA